MGEVDIFLSMLCRVETTGNRVSFTRCRTTDEKRCVVIDLLRHAREDEMSREDLVICREALEQLGG